MKSLYFYNIGKSRDRVWLAISQHSTTICAGLVNSKNTLQMNLSNQFTDVLFRQRREIPNMTSHHQPPHQQRGRELNLLRRALVPPRVIVEIQLVIILGIPPLSCRNHFSSDILALEPLLLSSGDDFLRRGLLFRRVVEDGRSVLRAHVRALSVWRRRIVHAEEELNQCLV